MQLINKPAGFLGNYYTCVCIIQLTRSKDDDDQSGVNLEESCQRKSFFKCKNIHNQGIIKRGTVIGDDDEWNQLLKCFFFFQSIDPKENQLECFFFRCGSALFFFL